MSARLRLRLYAAWLALGCLLIGLAACAPTLTPTPSPTLAPTPSTGRLSAAWVDAGNLLVWRTGEAAPRRIASGAVIQPILGPDGSRVAFTRGPRGSALSLWAADLDGVAERELAGPDELAIDLDPAQGARQIGQVAWLDARTVIFNTLIVPRTPGPGGRKADDLWRADAQTGAITRLLADGQGGDFAISPDGTALALVTPGAYGAAQGLIRLVDPQGQPLTELLSFEAASTASEYAFYPSVHWLADSSALLVAIPDRDLIYPPGAGETPRLAALWRLTPDGAAEPLGSVPATFFGLPRWSRDGDWLTYLQQEGVPADNRLGLVLAHGDGTQPTPLVSGAVGALEPPVWDASGFTYTFGAPGQVWRVQPGRPPIPFAGGDPAFALRWADATTAVYASAATTPYELRLFDLDNPIPARIAVVGGAAEGGFPAFDAVRIP